MSRDILLSLIDADPEQPRKHFDEVVIAELAQSIAANGLIQAIMVRPGRGGRYTIVHGERRCRAARFLGWDSIPAEIRELEPDEAHWLSLIENIQRSDLSPIEEAEAYRDKLTGSITEVELARRIGKTQSYIAQKLRLLKLPCDVRESIGKGGLKEGHARQLLRLDDPAQQSDLGRKAVEESWPVTRVKLEIDLIFRAKIKQPETPAELVVWIFNHSGKSKYENHGPYPEEVLPEYFTAPETVKRLPIASIIMHPKLDVRKDGRKPEYAQWLSEIFEVLPPIAVFWDGEQYLASDGWYRLEAAQLLGLKDIEARIYSGAQDKAFHYAITANSRHGRNYSREELTGIVNEGRIKGWFLDKQTSDDGQAHEPEPVGVSE